ncbi:lamin tail domain-containing protein [Nafulsella turpanensis]|uniref:lamin tail domain-containing protein n=1 Tax=Nafulsella turpanensis TaxID=1265690 RepID=UPI0003491254|nr:lamin tail domain-containing protein [Nafulsella turpanensis]
MKIPSLLLFFLFGIFLQVSAQVNSFPYQQSFESSFQAGEQVEFLPGWWGNEVSDGSSRIYQAGAAEASSGEAALGILPTSSFTGEVRLALDASSLEAGELSFRARSGQNGSGSRPAVLTVDFSADGGQTFTGVQEVGSFPNANTAYQEYQLSLPEEILGQPEAVVRFRVSRGASGEGTVARFLMDDVTVTEEPVEFRLLSAEATAQQEVILTFNRALAPASAEKPTNYTIEPGVEAKSATIINADPRQVVLNTSPLQTGQSYTVELGAVQDKEGNIAAGQQATFTYTESKELQTYDLLISEIHAAPKENTLLPNVEWVEVYNATGQTINLEGVLFADEGKKTRLPAYSLEPGAFVVLAPAKEAGQLEPYGPVLGLSSWPGLNNDEDVLSLLSPEGKVLDRVAYTNSWYGDGQKAAGGWSLERMDLGAPCRGAENWTAATATAGGTPAAPNSVQEAMPDLRGPELLMVYAIDSLHLKILFSEAVDTARLSPENFLLNPSIPFQSVEVMEPGVILLQLQEPLTAGESYTLVINNFTDCSGNLVTEASAEVVYPKAAEAGDVVLNEVMFDPVASSEEWVEIANASSQYINLKNWQLATFDGGIRSTAVLSRNDLILSPNGFLVFTRDAQAVLSAFPQLPPEYLLEVEALPTLRNEGDTLALINAEGEIVELFGYSENLHSPFVQETKGVSLERISLQAPAPDPANWTSAAGTVGYGTPGQENSQHYNGAPISAAMVVEPGLILPEGDGLADYAVIRFVAERQGLMATLRVYDSHGREVKVLAHNELIGSEGFFTWDGSSQEEAIVPTGYYILVLQVFNAEGYKEKFQQTIVVGNELR